MSIVDKIKQHKAEKAEDKHRRELEEKTAKELGVNAAVDNGKKDKHDADRAYRQQLTIDNYKSAVGDMLNLIHNELYAGGADDRFVTMTHELIDVLGRINLNPKAKGTGVMINFIAKRADEIAMLCHGGYFASVGEGLNYLRGLLLDMEDNQIADILYTDEEYLRLRTNLTKLESLKLSYLRDRDLNSRNKDALVDRMEDMDDDEYVMEAEQLNAEEQSIKDQIANITTDINTGRLALTKKKDQLVRDLGTRAAIAKDVAKVAQTQTAIDQTGIDKQMDESRETLRQNNRSASSSAMHVAQAPEEKRKMTREEKLALLGKK